MAFLFALRMWDRAVGSISPTAFYPALAMCLLPWLAGFAHWAGACRHASPSEAAALEPSSNRAVFTSVVAAYLAVLSVGLLLLQISVRPK